MIFYYALSHCDTVEVMNSASFVSEQPANKFQDHLISRTRLT